MQSLVLPKAWAAAIGMRKGLEYSRTPELSTKKNFFCFFGHAIGYEDRAQAEILKATDWTNFFKATCGSLGPMQLSMCICSDCLQGRMGSENIRKPICQGNSGHFASLCSLSRKVSLSSASGSGSGLGFKNFDASKKGKILRIMARDGHILFMQLQQLPESLSPTQRGGVYNGNGWKRILWTVQIQIHSNIFKNGSNLVMMSGKIGSCTKQIQRTGRLILWYSYSWKPSASLFSGQSLHWCQQLPANWVFQKSEAVNLGVLLTSELQKHRTWSRVQHGPTPSYDTGSLCTLAWNLASSLSSDHEPPSNVESNVDAISHTFDASIYNLNLFLEVYKFRSLKSLNSWRQRSASLKITTQCSCTNSDSSNEPRFAKLWKSFSASANWHAGRCTSANSSVL